MKPSFRQEAARILRFGLAGVLNTLTGFGVILVLQLGLGVTPALANAVGFLAGWVLSFALARLFVFASRDPVRGTLPRFAVAVAIGFALNQAVLAAAGRALGGAWPWMAQAAGVATYSAVLFLACRFWVFPADEAGNAGEPSSALPTLR